MARRVYDSPAWRTVRLAVLERDGHRCQIGGPRCTQHATEVDHIVAIDDGGAPYDPQNLRAACKRCNSARRVGKQQAAAPPSRDW